MDLRNILLDIHALEEELLDFERKYGIRSETLYAAYVNGEEPKDDGWVLDFGEWASVYKTWLTRQAEYRNAETPTVNASSTADHWLATAGIFADDPTLLPMLDEIYAERNRA